MTNKCDFHGTRNVPPKQFEHKAFWVIDQRGILPDTCRSAVLSGEGWLTWHVQIWQLSCQGCRLAYLTHADLTLSCQGYSMLAHLTCADLTAVLPELGRLTWHIHIWRLSCQVYSMLALLTCADLAAVLPGLCRLTWHIQIWRLSCQVYIMLAHLTCADLAAVLPGLGRLTWHLQIWRLSCQGYSMLVAHLTCADLTAVLPGLIVVFELSVRQLAVFPAIAVLQTCNIGIGLQFLLQLDVKVSELWLKTENWPLALRSWTLMLAACWLTRAPCPAGSTPSPPSPWNKELR